MLGIVQGEIQTQMYLFPKSLSFLLNHDVLMYLCWVQGRKRNGRGEKTEVVYILRVSTQQKNATNVESSSANLGGCLTTIGQGEELDLVYTSRLLP